MPAEERDARRAQGELCAGRARDSGEGERVPCADLQDALPLLQDQPAKTLKMGLYPVEDGGGA